ncbi:MAG: aminopeptidase P family protein [Theionarchaea archaeon]|nr:aminopeptidase P family protein [Theionarchaea archaeon]
MLFNIERAQRIMDEQGIDVLIATTPQNVYYTSELWSISHWQGLLSESHVFVVLSRDSDFEPLVIMPVVDVDLAVDLPTRIGKREDIRVYGTFFVVKGGDITPPESEIAELIEGSSETSALALLLQTLQDNGLSGCTCAIDESGLSPLDYSVMVKKFPGNLCEGSSIFQAIRMVKTPEEIRRLKESFSITEQALFSSLETMEKGYSERNLARDFEHCIYEKGGTPYFTVIGSGRRSAFTNAQPTGKKIMEGDIIRFDVGCVYEFYHSDMARIASLGTPPSTYESLYEAILQGEECALSEIRSGIQVSQIFDTAVNTIREAGIPHYRRNHVGHGIGMTMYDLPLLTPEGTTVLEENMVLCIETPFYELGVAGIQIEDAVCVKRNGYEPLTSSSRTIHII